MPLSEAGPPWHTPASLTGLAKHPVTLHVTSNYLRTHNPTKPTRRRIRPNTPTWAPDPSYPHMHVAAPEVALIDCLIDLQRNYYTWWTYQVPQQQPWEVRATQLIDALHQHHPLNLPLLHSAARNIFNARKLEKLLNQSHPISKSPSTNKPRPIGFSPPPMRAGNQSALPTVSSETPMPSPKTSSTQSNERPLANSRP